MYEAFVSAERGAALRGAAARCRPAGPCGRGRPLYRVVHRRGHIGKGRPQRRDDAGPHRSRCRHGAPGIVPARPVCLHPRPWIRPAQCGLFLRRRGAASQDAGGELRRQRRAYRHGALSHAGAGCGPAGRRGGGDHRVRASAAQQNSGGLQPPGGPCGGRRPAGNRGRASAQRPAGPELLPHPQNRQ